jgi:hypothetical protein
MVRTLHPFSYDVEEFWRDANGNGTWDSGEDEDRHDLGAALRGTVGPEEAAADPAHDRDLELGLELVAPGFGRVAPRHRNRDATPVRVADRQIELDHERTGREFPRVGCRSDAATQDHMVECLGMGHWDLLGFVRRAEQREEGVDDLHRREGVSRSR